MSFLAHPLTRGLDVDDPKTTELRRQIIKQKRFLFKLYSEWYFLIGENLPAVDGKIVELGSGAGFLKEVMPDVITTEVLPLDGIDVQLPADGTLPFADNSLRAIVMTDVLHHIRTPRSFLREATRCVREGGAIVMIEPWVTAWSRFVYSRLHDEPFRPDSPEWEFPEQGPLSGANGALPWIIFERDREQFEKEFPEWQIQKMQPMMPLSYLLSGGVSMRALFPGVMYQPVRALERDFKGLEENMAMFAVITLLRS
jgi:SAM-dependent methyltransferase